MIKHEHSFGIVPFKYEGGKWHVLLVLHHMSQHWSFPKGKSLPGEDPITSAKRELKEETHLNVKELLSTTPLIETYRFRRKKEVVHKTVYFFPAIVSGKVKRQEEEIDETKWLALEDARKQLSFKEARHVLQEGAKLLGPFIRRGNCHRRGR